MNNTHALLLAFIEASGYEVEEVETVVKGHLSQGMGMDRRPITFTTPDTIDIDYKVTKKQSAVQDRIDEQRAIGQYEAMYGRKLY